ncbi:MAG: DUF2946 family protein [Hyphomicrobium sp.]
MGIGFKSRGGSVRQWAARVLVVLFALRALVPAGFMPDFAAARDGGVRLVICTAQGLATITIPGDGEGHAPNRNGPQDNCPFGMMPVASNAPAPLVVTVAIALGAVETSFPDAAHPVPRRIGPALGSRGPPTA